MSFQPLEVFKVYGLEGVSPRRLPCNCQHLAKLEASAGEAASKPEAGASPAPPVPKTFEKPPEVVAFESGKEIMDLLRNKHPHAITALELMMTEIGAWFWLSTDLHIA